MNKKNNAEVKFLDMQSFTQDEKDSLRLLVTTRNQTAKNLLSTDQYALLQSNNYERAIWFVLE